jgi:hypothetical protein
MAKIERSARQIGRGSMADETRVTGSSLTSFDDAARTAFGMVRGDPNAEGMKAAEVSRMTMTGGGFVGVTQYHVELRVLGRAYEEPKETPWTCERWYAYHDFMPGSPPTLHVGGSCTAPSNGYHFLLFRAEPQGINPKILLLRLMVEEPEISNPVVTTYDVRFREDTDMRYDSVSILPDGPSELEIQIVS